MDYGSMLGESFAYAKDAVVGKWMQWLLLIIATVVFCIPLLGYVVRVLRGDKPAPEVNDWVALVIDGIKYLVITIIYSLPALVIFFVTVGTSFIALLSGEPSDVLAGMEGLLFGFVLVLIVGVICALFGTMGLLRFARTGSTGEAFNFPEIKDTIGRIGWGAYVVALLIIMVVQFFIGIVIGIIMMVPVLGFVIEFILVAPIAIFEARYLALVYERA